MEMERAEITEEGITFRVFRVLHGVVQDQARADSVRDTLEKAWGMPVVLLSQQSGSLTYYRGRSDLVRYLRTVDPDVLPWERFECDPLTNEFG
jgi:hypothetical protein